MHRLPLTATAGCAGGSATAARRSCTPQQQDGARTGPLAHCSSFCNIHQSAWRGLGLCKGSREQRKGRPVLMLGGASAGPVKRHMRLVLRQALVGRRAEYELC